jgi:hypothetical protein
MEEERDKKIDSLMFNLYMELLKYSDEMRIGMEPPVKDYKELIKFFINSDWMQINIKNKKVK